MLCQVSCQCPAAPLGCHHRHHKISAIMDASERLTVGKTGYMLSSANASQSRPVLFSSEHCELLGEIFTSLESMGGLPPVEMAPGIHPRISGFQLFPYLRWACLARDADSPRLPKLHKEDRPIQYGKERVDLKVMTMWCQCWDSGHLVSATDLPCDLGLVT